MSNSLGFSANGIAFGGANVANVTIDASSANDAIALPIGPASSRPAGALGYLRFSTDLDTLEYYKSTGWAIPGSSNAFVWQNGTLVLAMPNNANIQFLNTGTSNIVVTANGSNQVNVSVTVNAAGITANSGGANTQIQYNNNGVLGASPNLTFNVATNNFVVGANASFGNIADQTGGLGKFVFDATGAAPLEAIGGTTFTIGDMVTSANNVTLYLRSTGTANIRSAGNIALTFNGGVTGLKGNASGGFTFFAPTTAAPALTVNGNTGSSAISVGGLLQLLASSAVLPAAYASGFNFENPNTRFYIGDGTGYSFNFSKRASSTTTDLISITDTGATTMGPPPSAVNALHVIAANGTYNIVQVTGQETSGNGIRFRDKPANVDRGYIGYGNNTIAGIGNQGFGICPATGGHTYIGTVNGGGSVAKFDGTTGEVTLTSQSGGGRYSLRLSAPTNTDCYADFSGNNTVSGTTSFTVGQAADSNAYLYQRANFAIIFGTNNTSRAILNGNGNWTFNAPNSGAGATFNSSASSGYLLDLNGGAAATSYSTYRVAGTARGYIGTDGGAILGGGTGTLFGIRSESDLLLMAGASDRVRVLSAGGMSVVTTSGAAMTLTTTTNGTIFSMSDGVVSSAMVISGGAALQLGTSSAHALDFYTTNTTRLRFTSGGSMYFLGGGATFNSISTTASAGNAFLDNANGNNLLRSTSSIRYKTNVSSLLDADLLMQLRPITYTSKASSDDPTVLHYGLIAEEVANVTPMLVQYGKDEDGNNIPDGVQYDRLTVLLLKQIQTLTAQVATLTDRLNKLTANT